MHLFRSVLQAEKLPQWGEHRPARVHPASLAALARRWRSPVSGGEGKGRPACGKGDRAPGAELPPGGFAEGPRRGKDWAPARTTTLAPYTAAPWLGAPQVLWGNRSLIGVVTPRNRPSKWRHPGAQKICSACDKCRWRAVKRAAERGRERGKKRFRPRVCALGETTSRPRPRRA